MAEPILTVEHLVKGYGENTVLDDVSFSVRPGEVVVVVGPRTGQELPAGAVRRPEAARCHRPRTGDAP